MNSTTHVPADNPRSPAPAAFHRALQHAMRPSGLQRRAHEAQQIPRSKSPPAQQSDQVKPRGSPRRSARLLNPHRAAASSDQIHFPNAENCPPAQTTPAVSVLPPADPFAQSARTSAYLKAEPQAPESAQVSLRLRLQAHIRIAAQPRLRPGSRTAVPRVNSASHDLQPTREI